MNELIWLGILIISIIGVLVFYKFFGKKGLYVWSAIAVILANIVAIKSVTLFGLETVLGIAIFSSSLLAINILNEKYGKKEAFKAVMLTFITLILFTFIMQLEVLFDPSSISSASDSIKQIFTLNIMIFVGSIIAYIISQTVNISIYHQLKEKYHKPWLSNLVSISVAQLLDTVLFLSIAFIGTVSTSVLIEMFIARYILKIVAAVVSTPAIMISSKIKPI